MWHFLSIPICTFSCTFPLSHSFPHASSEDDHEPIATTPTHEADQGHMSGAEEAPPTSNPTPAVVPSPDDSAKEVTQQEEVGLGEEEGGGASVEDQDESKFIDVEGDDLEGEEPRAERLDSVTIDPSYNPSGEELLYEGDMDAEQPLPKSNTVPDKESGSQDEGFMINVHETGMELDMAVSDSHSKNGSKAENDGSGAKSSPRWRAGEEGVGSKTTPSSKTASGSKSTSSPRARKDVDRFVM